jgi:hypothetical protein
VKYTCEKCGRNFSRKSNMEMHQKFCNGVNNEGKINDKLRIKKKITDTDKKDKNVECPKSKTGLHDLVILKNINPIQQKAILGGYTAYCRICKELI